MEQVRRDLLLTLRGIMRRAALLLCMLLVPVSGSAKGKEKPKAPAAPIGSSSSTELAVDAATKDDARKLAEAYLQALTGEGDPKALEALFGGATMTAKIFSLANWKIAARDAGKVEKGKIAGVVANVEALDKEGRDALGKLMGGGPAPDLANAGEGDLLMDELTASDAAKLLEPTRARAKLFLQTHPTFASVARVDKEVYWHPKNPFRRALAEAGGACDYTLTFHRFWIETSEGLGTQTIRKWPLRVLRLQCGASDTGWRILPASDWNAE